jgi:hypothetical protein
MNKSDFQKFFNDDVSYYVIGEYFPGETPTNIPIESILSINREELKPFTLDLLESLRDEDSFKEICLGIRAYTQFQDILEVELEDEIPLINRHYCFYESLFYLRESIVSWLDKNVLSAMVLIRPYMENSIFHLYWYLRGDEKGYESFYKWMEGKKHKPPFQNQLDYIFSNLTTKKVLDSKRVSYIKQIIKNFYKSMSAYNHTPKIDESMVTMGGGYGNSSFYSFWFYVENLKLLLRQLIYLYILIYPMALFPVNRFRKWGYGGVSGVYFDENNAAILRAYLGQKNYEKMRDSICMHKKVISLVDWF